MAHTMLAERIERDVRTAQLGAMFVIAAGARDVEIPNLVLELGELEDFLVSPPPFTVADARLLVIREALEIDHG